MKELIWTYTLFHDFNPKNKIKGKISKFASLSLKFFLPATRKRRQPVLY